MSKDSKIDHRKFDVVAFMTQSTPALFVIAAAASYYNIDLADFKVVSCCILSAAAMAFTSRLILNPLFAYLEMKPTDQVRTLCNVLLNAAIAAELFSLVVMKAAA